MLAIVGVGIFLYYQGYLGGGVSQLVFTSGQTVREDNFCAWTDPNVLMRAVTVESQDIPLRVEIYSCPNRIYLSGRDITTTGSYTEYGYKIYVFTKVGGTTTTTIPSSCSNPSGNDGSFKKTCINSNTYYGYQCSSGSWIKFDEFTCPSGEICKQVDSYSAICEQPPIPIYDFPSTQNPSPFILNRCDSPRGQQVAAVRFTALGSYVNIDCVSGDIIERNANVGDTITILGGRRYVFSTYIIPTPTPGCVWNGQQYPIGQSVENCESDNNVYRFVCTSDGFNPNGHWVKNPTTPISTGCVPTTTTTTQPDFCKMFPQLCNLTSMQMFLLIIGVIVIVAGIYIYGTGKKR